MKNYYLGIDGGGTKTAFTIIDDDKKIVYQNTIGPSSVDTVDIASIKKNFIEEFSRHKYPIASIFAGIGGITCDEDITRINEILSLHPMLIDKANIDSNNDVVNALYGALNGKDGIIVIAGTGSVAYGKYKGKYARSGGYCYQEGDAGSSYNLGYTALQYLARVIDGRANAGELSRELMEETKCYEYKDLAKFFIEASRTKIASLAKVVTKAANDPYSYEIIDRGTDEIMLMIKAVYNRLEIVEGFSFSIIGSLGNADTLYKKLLLEKLNKFNSKVNALSAIYSPAIGSALKAYELVNKIGE